ncbi:hypothetical protein ABK040_006062 [Willaertia magna]
MATSTHQDAMSSILPTFRGSSKTSSSSTTVTEMNDIESPLLLNNNKISDDDNISLKIKKTNSTIRIFKCIRISRKLFYILLSILIFTIFFTIYIYLQNKPKSIFPIYLAKPKTHLSKLYENENLKWMTKNGNIIKTNTNPSFYIKTLNPEDDVWISKNLFQYGYWESAIEELFELLLKHQINKENKNQKIFPCIVVDIGANLGFFTLLSASYGCKVYSYEIQPKLIQNIKTSINLNQFDLIENHLPEQVIENSDMRLKLKEDGLVSLKHNAVYESAGQYVTFQLGSNNNYGSASLINSELKFPKEGSVSTVILDEEFFANEIPINILKIDVEGGEKFVLRGAKRTLDFMVDHVIIESAIRDGVEIFNILLEAGFDKVVILEEPRWFWTFFVKSSYPKVFYKPSVYDITNYLMTLKGKRDIWFSKTTNTMKYYGYE